MSEREPITAELRGKMDTLGWYDEDGNIVFTTGGTPVSERACLAINSKTFGELCDAIDAVHAGLERENEELRERLAVLDNRSESMHIGSATVTITDELRKWGYGFCGDTHDVVTAIADRIDAEHERELAEQQDSFTVGMQPMTEENMAEGGWVRGPLDADGKMWRRGDMSDSNWGVIEGIAYEDGRWFVSGHDTSAPWIPADSIRHYHEPTVEDVLTKFGIDWEYESDCEDRAALLKEYAAKLRLAEEKDA